MGKSYKNEGGGNKAARMAQKEQAALSKQRAEDDRDAREEAARWETGTKKGGKKEEQASKRAEQLRRKAEREQALEQEEADTPGRRSGPKKSNQPEKKTRGPDLSQFDKDDDRGNGDNKKLPTLNATGIDNALDALGLDDDAPGGGGGGGSSGNKIERHPERRYPAAYARFEERRLEEMKEDGSGEGLRMNQRKAQIRKEFERHPDNPFNQVTASYNATKEELGEIRSGTAAAIEARLAARDDGGDGDGDN